MFCGLANRDEPNLPTPLGMRYRHYLILQQPEGEKPLYEQFIVHGRSNDGLGTTCTGGLPTPRISHRKAVPLSDLRDFRARSLDAALRPVVPL